MNTKASPQSIFVLFALLFILTGCSIGKQVSSAVSSVSNRMKIVGESMAPTIRDGQVVTCKAIQLTDLKHGDILCFRNGDIKSIKRLVGLPDETIKIRDGVVYINDQALEETYLTNPAPETISKITLSDDEYYVLGDNRNKSKDSRSFGPIKAGDILGRVEPIP